MTGQKSFDEAIKAAGKSLSPDCDNVLGGFEKIAVVFFQHRGYEIVEESWTCSAGGPIVVAKNDDTLIFVEVTARRKTSEGFGDPGASRLKQRRFEQIAVTYLDLVDTEIEIKNVRFDVISLLVVGKGRVFVRHHINALSAAGEALIDLSARFVLKDRSSIL